MNVASQYGGGLYVNSGGEATLINSNVYQNEASCCEWQRGGADIENNALLSITSSHVGASRYGPNIKNSGLLSITSSHVRAG